MQWKDISLYKYLSIIDKEDTFEIVSILFDCDARELPYTSFIAKCSELKELFSKPIEETKGTIKCKVGKYKLIPNANQLKAGAFIDLCEYQKQNDLVHCVGIMYGASNDDECKEVCELLSIQDGLVLIRFFYQASKELLNRIQVSSEGADQVKKYLQVAIAQIQQLGWI